MVRVVFPERDVQGRSNHRGFFVQQHREEVVGIPVVADPAKQRQVMVAALGAGQVGAPFVRNDLDGDTQLREVGVRYRMVRTRLAKRALAKINPELGDSLQGRCAFVFAENEDAIKAAKVLREWIRKNKKTPAIAIRGGMVEGTVYAGDDAAALAELPDRETVQTQIVSVISGPARSLASVFNAVAAGLTRCIQARVDKGDA